MRVVVDAGVHRSRPPQGIEPVLVVCDAQLLVPRSTCIGAGMFALVAVVSAFGGLLCDQSAISA